MNKKVKSLSIVLPFSFILAGLTILCYLLDPAFEPDAYRVSSLVIVSIMVFFVIPTILFAVRQMKKTVKKSRLHKGSAAECIWDFGWVLAAL